MDYIGQGIIFVFAIAIVSAVAPMIRKEMNKQKPKKGDISDPVLGILRLNKESKFWEGSFVYDKHKVELFIEYLDQPPKNPDQLVEKLRAFVECFPENNKVFKQYCAQKLLKTAQEWHKGASEKDFEKIIPETFVLTPGETINIVYSDAGVFDGHTLWAYLNKDGAPRRAEMMG